MMHFSMIIILCFHFLLCQRVSSLQNSFLLNQTSVDNVGNILGKFFAKLGKTYLGKSDFWQVTIVGAQDVGLRQAQSLIEGYPHNICKDPESCAYSNDFMSGNFMLIFPENLSEKTLDKHLKILSRCKSHCEVLFVSEAAIINTNEISSFLIRAVQQRVTFPQLAHIEKNSIRLHRSYYSKDCISSAKSRLFRRPETDWSKIFSPNTRRKPNLSGCPLTLGTIRSIPQMVTEKSPNGSIVIVSGREGNLVMLFAEVFNFSIVIKYPTVAVDQTESRKESMITEAADETVSFAIGRIRPVNYQHKKIEFSNSYDVECVTWGTPRLMGSTVNLVWTEFPWKVWALIGSVFAITCLTEYARHRIDPKENGNPKNVTFLSTVFDLVAINLGYPVTHIPISKWAKTMFMLHVFYSTVITTAYKTSLASILATVPSSTTISNVRGIIDENLKVGGSQYNLNILKEQDGEIVAKLIERYEAIHDSDVLMNRLKNDHDFACLNRRSTFTHEKRMAVLAQELITFDVFKSCYLTYPSVIIFPEGSFLRDPVNRILQRVIESGILTHWDHNTEANDEILERKNAERFSEKLAKQKFVNVFIFYCGCICVCIFVFFIELLTSKLKA